MAPSVALSVAGVSTLLTLPVSFGTIFGHLSNYGCPSEQRWVIGVCSMVPVYAIVSYLSLLLLSADGYDEDGLSARATGWLDLGRDCYEAYALYCFGQFLLNALGGEAASGLRLHELGGEREEGSWFHHPWYARLMFLPGAACCGVHRSWELGPDFVSKFKYGIVQYMAVKVATSVIGAVAAASTEGGETAFRDHSYLYLVLVLVVTFSQGWAMYCLIAFYTVAHDLLAGRKLLLKFAALKGVIFFTWWQGVLLDYFGRFAHCKQNPHMCLGFSDTQAFQASAQDVLICFEMLCFALIHLFAYPWEGYAREGAAGDGRGVPLLASWQHASQAIFEAPADITQAARATMRFQPGAASAPEFPEQEIFWRDVLLQENAKREATVAAKASQAAAAAGGADIDRIRAHYSAQNAPPTKSVLRPVDHQLGGGKQSTVDVADGDDLEAGRVADQQTSLAHNNPFDLWDSDSE